MLQNLRHDFRMYRLSLFAQFKAAAALRTAFMIQILGMVLNNLALLAAWLFLFQRFGTINGWGAAELVGVQGINMLIFGVVMFVSVGIMDLPRHVDQGSFDDFLIRPGSVLGQLSSSNIDVTTGGDILLGIILTTWYVIHAHIQPLTALVFLASLVVGCVIFWCMALLLPNLLAFYVYDSERLSRYIGALFLDGAIYPTGVLTGVLRTILLTVFPSLLIGAVQVNVLRGVGWQWVGLGAVIAVVWLIFSLWLFRRSLRRYESANLIGAR